MTASSAINSPYARLAAAGIKLPGPPIGVRRIVKVFGMVNAARDFADHPAVINGCSDLLVDISGSAGAYARSATSVGSLPGRISVEIEMIVAVRP